MKIKSSVQFGDTLTKNMYYLKFYKVGTGYIVLHSYDNLNWKLGDYSKESHTDISAVLHDYFGLGETKPSFDIKKDSKSIFEEEYSAGDIFRHNCCGNEYMIIKIGKQYAITHLSDGYVDSSRYDNVDDLVNKALPPTQYTRIKKWNE